MKYEDSPMSQLPGWTSKCISAVIAETVSSGASAAAILGHARDVAANPAENGITRRVLVCARCSLVAYIEHDKDLKIVDVQDPARLIDYCRFPEISLPGITPNAGPMES